MDRRTANRATAALVAFGLIASAIVYFTAKPAVDLLDDPLTHKKYILELERYGGKSNVAAAEFTQWFQSLWQGRNLAFTLAALTLLIAWGFWYVATMPAIESHDPTPPENEVR